MKELGRSWSAGLLLPLYRQGNWPQCGSHWSEPSQPVSQPPGLKSMKRRPFLYWLLPREGPLRPAEEEVGDDFQCLENTNVPVLTTPSILLAGPSFRCPLGGTPGSPSITISLYFRDTQLVYPKMTNTASSVTVSAAADSPVCRCTKA